MKDENRKIARLIKQIQRGNQSAFEEFYKLTSPKAYFIALKITQNEHDAEDILQESYIKALEKINEIDTSQNINSWFLKIVSNKSKDLLKSRNHLVFDSEEESCFDEIPEEKAEFRPEENLNQEELRLEVMAAIDELTAEKRACIMMMYFGDMSVKEIAESIEVPESTVKNRLYTARKDLRTKFEKNGNVLYGAALGGVLIWALNKTAETTASAFTASTASGMVLAGINEASATAFSAASTPTVAATTVVSSSSAAATGTGIAAKLAALSVAQKVVAGVAATAVIGGSTAGVATVAKKIVSSNEITTYIEEVTTAPSQTEEYAFAVIHTEESTTEWSLTTEKNEPTATVRDESTTKRPSVTSTTKTKTGTSTTKQTTTKKETTTKKQTATTMPTTTEPTTTSPTTTKPTTTESTTKEETTTKLTTTEPSTTQPVTTQPTTTEPTTTEPTTQAPATVNVEIVDMNEDVVATFSFTVEAGTEMTWEYLVAQIKNKGYEPKAGIYGDAVGAVAESGTTYTITAEL